MSTSSLARPTAPARFAVCEAASPSSNFGTIKSNKGEMIRSGCFEAMLAMVFAAVFRTATSVYNAAANAVLVVSITFSSKASCTTGPKILNNCNASTSDCSVAVGAFSGGACVIGFIMSASNAPSWLKTSAPKSEAAERITASPPRLAIVASLITSSSTMPATDFFFFPSSSSSSTSSVNPALGVSASSPQIIDVMFLRSLSLGDGEREVHSFIIAATEAAACACKSASRSRRTDDING